MKPAALLRLLSPTNQEAQKCEDEEVNLRFISAFLPVYMPLFSQQGRNVNKTTCGGSQMGHEIYIYRKDNLVLFPLMPPLL